MGADPVVATPPPLAVDEQRAILEARINMLQIELDAARAELAALPQET
jgi:hypothetical protein